MAGRRLRPGGDLCLRIVADSAGTSACFELRFELGSELWRQQGYADDQVEFRCCGSQEQRERLKLA